MLSVSTLILSFTLSFVPADESWLGLVSPETDIAIRVSGVEGSSKNLIAMLKAMSEKLGAQAQPAIEQGVEAFRAQAGNHAVTDPFVILVRAIAPENPASPPFAVIVKSDAYEGVLKGVIGDAELKLKPVDGIDSFDARDGQTWFAAKKSGHVIFGGDKILVGSFAKSDGKSRATSITTADQQRFARGDVGIYVNIAALTARYGDQIAQGKQAFMAALDQAPQAPGMAESMESVKKMYGVMFDGVKDFDSLVLSLDFSAEGLNVDGQVAAKSDSKIVKSLEKIKATPASDLATLPAGATYYMHATIDADLFSKLQSMGLNMMAPGGKSSKEITEILAKSKLTGTTEMNGSVSLGNGMRSLNVTKGSNLKSVLAATEEMYKAMTKLDGPMNLFKEIKVTPNAEKYQDVSFTRVEMIIDEEKLAKLQPGNPAAGNAIKAMYGGNTLISWYGASDEKLFQVVDKTWDGAKAQLDAMTSGKNNLGSINEFKSLRDKLPKQVSAVAIVDAQGLVQQVLATIGAMAGGNAPAKPATGSAVSSALLGMSLTVNPPTGLEFHIVLPSKVVTEIQKGIAPLIPGAQP